MANANVSRATFGTTTMNHAFNARKTTGPQKQNKKETLVCAKKETIFSYPISDHVAQQTPAIKKIKMNVYAMLVSSGISTISLASLVQKILGLLKLKMLMLVTASLQIIPT